MVEISVQLSSRFRGVTVHCRSTILEIAYSRAIAERELVHGGWSVDSLHRLFRNTVGVVLEACERHGSGAGDEAFRLWMLELGRLLNQAIYSPNNRVYAESRSAERVEQLSQPVSESRRRVSFFYTNLTSSTSWADQGGDPITGNLLGLRRQMDSFVLREFDTGAFGLNCYSPAVQYGSDGAPSRRARDLLLRCLTEEQRAMYEKYQYFEVKVPEPDRFGVSDRLQVKYGRVMNVYDSTRQRYYCAVPKGNFLPTEDILLGQKLVLENAPEVFFAAAKTVFGRALR